jgi:hypothetical protein
MPVLETTLLRAGDALDVPEKLERGADAIRALPSEMAQTPILHRLAEVVPLADLIFGGGVLILIVLVHATALRWIGGFLTRRVTSILKHPTFWHSDLLMVSIIFQLLALHLFEIFMWAAALVLTGLVPNWHNAGFFAGNTYTTIGYGSFLLPAAWEMVAPIMAISGLFTFGWSGSVLVDYVRRVHEIREAARAHKRDAT